MRCCTQEQVHWSLQEASMIWISSTAFFTEHSSSRGSSTLFRISELANPNFLSIISWLNFSLTLSRHHEWAYTQQTSTPSGIYIKENGPKMGLINRRMFRKPSASIDLALRDAFSCSTGSSRTVHHCLEGKRWPDAPLDRREANVESFDWMGSNAEKQFPLSRAPVFGWIHNNRIQVNEIQSNQLDPVVTEDRIQPESQLSFQLQV